MVRIRENCRPDTAGGGGASQEMAQGPDLAPVAVSGPSQVAVHADGQQVAIHADAHQVAVQAEDQPSAVHAAETIRHQKATRLPSTTSVVQASASQTSSPKTLPSEPNQVTPPGADATRLASTDGPRLPNASSEVATAKFADPGDASPAKVAVRPLNSKRIVLEYEIKEREKRTDNHIPPGEPILFFEVTPGDASEFSGVLQVHGERVDGYKILRAVSPAVPPVWSVPA